MSDTPETQKAVLDSDGQWSFVLKECCERLERERDEARESALRIDVLNFKLRKELDDAKSKIKSQADRIRYLEGATNHAKGTPLSVALRERDEARESLKHISEYGTEEINAAVELRQKLASALVERDEARSELSLKQQTLTIAEGTLSDLRKQRDEWSAMCGRYKQERDIAEQDATNYHARIIELIAERDKTKQERDETREKAERYRLEANSLMLQRDEAREALNKILKNE